MVDTVGVDVLENQLTLRRSAPLIGFALRRIAGESVRLRPVTIADNVPGIPIASPPPADPRPDASGIHSDTTHVFEIGHAGEQLHVADGTP